MSKVKTVRIKIKKMMTPSKRVIPKMEERKAMKQPTRMINPKNQCFM